MPTLILNGERSKLTGFRYFWLKTVRSFTPSCHCARCLVGEYCETVSAHMPAGRRRALEFPEGEILYLCGVAAPYRWANNAHLAVRAKHGAQATVTLYQGDTVEIDGAEALTFDDAAALERYPDKGAAFLTCRNFQFGAHYFPRSA